MPDGFDVFLSHNSRDKPVVEEIGALLEAYTLRLWLSAATKVKRAKPQRKWWNWGIAISLLGLIVTLAAWLRPLPPTSPPQPGKPGIYAVRVQVLDPQDHPIEGATVRTSAGNEPHRLPDGWWEIQIPSVKVPKDGRISLWADHQDWAGSRTDLTLGDDPNPRAEIHLKQPETWIRGRVEAKGALAEIRISRQDGGPGTAITDPDGHFDLKLPEPAGKKVRLRAARNASEVGDTFCYAGADNCSIPLEKP
jgi:hypothetical protein